MKKTIFFTVMALLYLNFWVDTPLFAQEKTVAIASISPVNPGSKVPEGFWSFEHEVYQNGKTAKQNLSAYKGKIIILGFWASFCGPCLSGLDTLTALQQKYPNDLYVLSVNAINSRDGFEKVNKLFSGKTEPFKSYHNASIIKDEYLSKLFPGRTVPKYVWIDQYGHLNAITGRAFLAAGVIEKLIKYFKQDQP